MRAHSGRPTKAKPVKNLPSGIYLRQSVFVIFTTILTGLFAVIHSLTAQTLAEALDTTNLAWTTGGDAAWFGQTTNTHDGFDAARSGIVSNQTSWVEATVV